jgi:hypothetical protein
MRFNAGHALNYYNVQPIARLTGIRELHIGHSIISRSVFTGLREAVREMKRLMREAAERGLRRDPRRRHRHRAGGAPGRRARASRRALCRAHPRRLRAPALPPRPTRPACWPSASPPRRPSARHSAPASPRRPRSTRCGWGTTPWASPVRVSPALAEHMRERGLHAHLSLSDETDYVVAFAVIEKP